jgi:hypothetical protein
MMVWPERHDRSTLQATLLHLTLPFSLAPLFDRALFQPQTQSSSSLEYAGVLSTDLYDFSLRDYYLYRFSFLSLIKPRDSASMLVQISPWLPHTSL